MSVEAEHGEENFCDSLVLSVEEIEQPGPKSKAGLEASDGADGSGGGADR
jgi:hypothetical protein